MNLLFGYFSALLLLSITCVIIAIRAGDYSSACVAILMAIVLAYFIWKLIKLQKWIIEKGRK